MRLGIRPPGVKESWEDCGVLAQSMILAFDQIMTHDEDEREAHLVGARMPSATRKGRRP